MSSSASKRTGRWRIRMVWSLDPTSSISSRKRKCVHCFRICPKPRTIPGKSQSAVRWSLNSAKRSSRNLRHRMGKGILPISADCARKVCLRRYGDHPSQEVQDRLAYEQSVIEQMGYVNYYLIVYDFIRYARSVDIPVGPGRGSGAGSLAAYCLGITSIDPIRYHLLFERFLTRSVSACRTLMWISAIERRPEMIEYVVRKYGADSCGTDCDIRHDGGARFPEGCRTGNGNSV